MPTTVGEVQESVVEIRVSQIHPNPYQPRHRFDEQALRELAQSVKESGLAQPVVVRYGKQEGVYELVVGERRLRAFKMNESETIPAIVRDYSDEETREMVLTENLQREDLTPMEEARALRMLVDQYEGAFAQVADRMGKSEPYIRGRVALLSLPESIQDMLEEGILNVGQAGAIVELGSEKEQLTAAKKAYRLRLTPEQIRGSMQPKKGTNPSGGQRTGIVRSSTLMRALPQVYDMIEGFEYPKLKDAAKRMALRRQLVNLQKKIRPVPK